MTAETLSPPVATGWLALPECWTALLHAWDELDNDGAGVWGKRLMKLMAADEAHAWCHTAKSGAAIERSELFRGEHGMSLVVRRWAAREHTAIHDHGEAPGAEIVLAGALVVHPYRHIEGRLIARDPHVVLAGCVELLDASLIHSVENLLTQPTLSMNLYGPASRSRRLYPLG